MSDTWGTGFYVLGSYAPTIGDGSNNFTTSTATGYYTLIGNLVHADIYIVWTGKGSASAGSTVRISLPFTIGARTPRLCATIGAFSNITYVSQVNAFADTGLNYILLSSNTTAMGNTNVAVSGCGTTGELQLSVNYMK